ncbi:MAG: glycosyltransferase [Opitutales bacterium]|nr:glycosyltransferase [Opitutales bacterium]
MIPPPTISMVVPTYNCRHLLIAHLRAMQAWLDLIEEVIVVDSRSTDGTLELIRSELRHPRLRIIERDRGLYQSWNEGIAATTGDWVYISTAGDLITRNHLLHLREVGEALGASVVVSPPDFAHEDGRPHRDLGWPPAKLLAAFGQGHPFVMQPEATQFLAFQNCPNAILGSSASNLYRGPHLRARPFPMEYGVVGDTAWIMRYGHETRLALTPRSGSTFCIHEKESQLTPEQCVELHRRLIGHESARLRETTQLSSRLANLLGEQDQPVHTKRLWAEKRRLWHAPESRLANKFRWVSVTLRYLWSRLKDKRQARQAMQALQIKSALFTHLTD